MLNKNAPNINFPKIYYSIKIDHYARQARRHGGHSGAVPPQMTACAPPNENCATPSEDCAPKKLTSLGLLEWKSMPKLVFTTSIFVIFVDWHRISWHFWDEDLFFFLLEITCFRPEKNVWISDFSRKIPLNFWSALCSFDPDWDKFLVSPCPSGIHINKLLVPPKIYFWPPSHAILTPGRIHHLPVLQK